MSNGDGFKEAPQPWGQRPSSLIGTAAFLARPPVYWWVNQKQTWRHEIDGGYMWSPKRKSNNSRNQFYENMHLVDAGDLVFSYFNQQIQYLGIIQRPAISWQKPDEFGLVGDYWNHEGWYVPVEWHKIPEPFRPRDYFDDIRSTLPQKYSPLNHDTGDGLQNVYLARVPREMAAILCARIGALAQDLEARRTTIGDDASVETLLDDAVEQRIVSNKFIDHTERDAVIKARRGQGVFKQNLIALEKRCRITGVTDSRLLVASHIKPWRSCASNDERLDGHNGFLLTPHVDRLFDRGYISFEESGRVLMSERVAPSQFLRLGLDVDKPLQVGEFSDRQNQYLEYHRKEIFLPGR